MERVKNGNFETVHRMDEGRGGGGKMAGKSGFNQLKGGW